MRVSQNKMSDIKWEPMLKCLMRTVDAVLDFDSELTLLAR